MTNDDKHLVYLNVNGGFEFWKDIRIQVLHIFNDSPAIIYVPFLVSVGNAIVNGIPTLVLALASHFIEQQWG